MVFRLDWEIFAKLQLLKLLKFLRTLVQSVILKTENFFSKRPSYYLLIINLKVVLKIPNIVVCFLYVSESMM